MTKGEVIRATKKSLNEYRFRQEGICYTINYTTLLFFTRMIYPSHVKELFPELNNRDLIKRFGGNPDKILFWERGVWDTGRLKFFNMLYDKYKDDNTEI